jgi:hypothetical protein
MTEEEQIESLYCDKCFESVNFFLDDAQSNSSAAQKYRKLYKEYKANLVDYKKKFQSLEFEFDEIKSLKEQYEEEFKSNSNKSKSHEVVPFNSTVINRDSIEIVTESETSIKLNLDLSYLKNHNTKVFRVDNLEKLFSQFAQAFAKTCVNPASDKLKAIDYTNKLVESLPKNCNCVLNVDAKSATTNTHTEHFPADYQNQSAKIQGN